MRQLGAVGYGFSLRLEVLLASWTALLLSMRRSGADTLLLVVHRAGAVSRSRTIQIARMEPPSTAIIAPVM